MIVSYLSNVVKNTRVDKFPCLTISTVTSALVKAGNLIFKFVFLSIKISCGTTFFPAHFSLKSLIQYSGFSTSNLPIAR